MGERRGVDPEHLVGVGVAVAADGDALDLGHLDRARRRATSPTAPGSASKPSSSASAAAAGWSACDHAVHRAGCLGQGRLGEGTAGAPSPRRPGATARSRSCPRRRANPLVVQPQRAPGEPVPRASASGRLVEGLDRRPRLGRRGDHPVDQREGARSRSARRRARRSARGLRRLDGRGDRSASGLLGRQHEAVADVADGADQGLVLGPELGPEAAYVDVDGAGAAEVVVAPDLLQQLVAGEDPAGVLGEVLQQLELLERQVERPRRRSWRCTSRRRRPPRRSGSRGRRARRRRARRAAGRWRAGCGPRARPARRCGARRRPCPSRGRRLPARPRSPRARPGSRCRWCAAAGTGRGRGRAPAGRRRGSGRRRGASIRALPSAGRIFTWWPSSASPGSTSALGWRALVSSSSVLMRSPPVGGGRARRDPMRKDIRAWRPGPTTSPEDETVADHRALLGLRPRRRRRETDALPVTGPLTLADVVRRCRRAAPRHPPARACSRPARCWSATSR